MMTERGMVLSRRAWLLAMSATGTLAALGRTPYGGSLDLKIPWAVDSLDPHAIDSAAAALFGPAIADSLYALDAQGRPYPTLAESLPEETAQGARVRLRPNLVTARGRPLDARDVIFSWKRSRAKAGAGLLGPLPEPVHDKKDGFAILVPDVDPIALATALISPVTSILPRGFNRIQPDGTGALMATVGRDTLLLERNPSAARGAAFLLQAKITRAIDLADALRAFEAGEVDVGWLGNGLHRPRPGAVPFTGPHFGWVVLRTGNRAGAWGAPGVAQRLLDGISPARLQHLGLEGIPKALGAQTWGGPPAELLYPTSAPHLAQIARSLSSILSTSGHELTPTERAASELDQRKASGDYVTMVDFVRRIGSRPVDTLLSLLCSVDPLMAERPPRVSSHDARVVARSLPLGVVGELHVRGAQMPAFQNLERWNLGAVYRR